MKWWVLSVLLLAPNIAHSFEQETSTKPFDDRRLREIIQTLKEKTPQPGPPITVIASGVTRQYQGIEANFMFHFSLYPRIEVEHVRAKIRFYVPIDVSNDGVNPAMCFLAVKEQHARKSKFSRTYGFS